MTSSPFDDLTAGQRMQVREVWGAAKTRTMRADLAKETVKVGDVWADNDPRVAGRTIRVDRIEGEYAYCTILTNDDETQQALDNPKGRSRRRDNRSRPTRIKLARFKPTSTGYRHVGGPDVARMLGGATFPMTEES